MPVVQLNLGTGVCRADKKPRQPKLTESALQSQIRRTLSFLGYTTEEIGATRARVTCPNCSHAHTPTGWQGNTVSTPDLQVFRDAPGFPPIGIRIEVKTATGAVRRGQAELASAGRSIIVRSVAEAVQAVIDAERSMTEYKTPPEKAEQLERFLEENKGRI